MTGKPVDFVAPTAFVFTARTAVLVSGTGKCALWVESCDVYGETIKRCLGYMGSPYSSEAQLVRRHAMQGCAMGAPHYELSTLF